MAENFEGNSVEREVGEHMPAIKIAKNTRIQYNKKVKQNWIDEWKKHKRAEKYLEEFTNLARKWNSGIWWRENINRLFRRMADAYFTLQKLRV